MLRDKCKHEALAQCCEQSQMILSVAPTGMVRSGDLPHNLVATITCELGYGIQHVAVIRARAPSCLYGRRNSLFPSETLSLDPCDLIHRT